MDATAWSDAEAAVRAQLTHDRMAIKAVTRLPGFSFANFDVELENGKKLGAVVVDGKVWVRGLGKRSNRTVGAILKAAKVLDTHAWTAMDLIYLVREYGAFTASQRPLERALAGAAWYPGKDPQLTWNGKAASLVLHWAAESRHKGSSPWVELEQATLRISSSYGISWKRSTVKVPAGALDL